MKNPEKIRKNRSHKNLVPHDIQFYTYYLSQKAPHEIECGKSAVSREKRVKEKPCSFFSLPQFFSSRAIFKKAFFSGYRNPR